MGVHPPDDLWSTLEEQPLLSSRAGGEGEKKKKKGILRRSVAWACAPLRELWALSRADPHKPVFPAKVALALALVSLLGFVREPSNIVVHSVWAILTVVVVFEYTIVVTRLATGEGCFYTHYGTVSATLSRGSNRALGTLIAGGLAIAVAESAKNLGKMEEVVIILSTFTVGFFTTLAKQHPRLKPYEYGFRVFLLTFGYVMVSGYITGNFTETAVSRFLFIALGAGVSLGINIGIYPIWAGEELHNLIAQNFVGVANSLEGCVDEYLKCMEYERISSNILLYQASDDPLYSGYRAAVEASAQEQILLDDAMWEPPHGPYKMTSYPWKGFTNVGGALRHCSFAAMALHGCILSEIQAPPESRKVFDPEIHRVGREGAKVLHDLGNKIKTMTKLSSSDIIYEVHLSAEELQKKIDDKSYLLVNTGRCDSRKRTERIKDGMNGSGVAGKENNNEAMEPTFADQTSAHHYKTFTASSFHSRYDSSAVHDYRKMLQSWPARTSNLPLEDGESGTNESARALSLATFCSLLIEFVARLQNVVYAFEELSDKANFKDPVDEPVAVSTSDGGFVAKICKFVGLRSWH